MATKRALFVADAWTGRRMNFQENPSNASPDTAGKAIRKCPYIVTDHK
jgi:hypothetical protein